VITSQTTNKEAQQKRVANLFNVFGESMWDGFTILGCGDDKTDVLAQWEGTNCYWIEDKEENIIDGNKFGLEGLLMSNHTNLNAFSCTRVNNWKEIYEIITGN
jgi:hypothetical protein